MRERAWIRERQLELLPTKKQLPPLPAHIKDELVRALAELLLEAAAESVEVEREDGNEHQDQS